MVAGDMKRKKPAARPKRSHEPRLRIVIDRALWMRGSPDNSRLLNDEGKMCCLGFLGRACGFTEEELGYAVSPSELPSVDDSLKGPGRVDDVDHPIGSGRWPKKIARTSWTDESTLTNHLMSINDADKKIAVSLGRTFKVPDESARERLITGLMAKAGVAVTFVGGLS
jgi:hypothetical protein